MKAEELVIRYWALSEGIGAYEKPLATFISNYAENNRNPSNEELNDLTKSIQVAHKRATKLFGKHCFSFSAEGRSRFNAAVFDAQMLACSKLPDAKFKVLETKVDEIRDAYEELQTDKDYARSVTLATSDKAALQGRIHKVSTLLKAFV